MENTGLREVLISYPQVKDIILDKNLIQRTKLVISPYNGRKHAHVETFYIFKINLGFVTKHLSKTYNKVQLKALWSKQIQLLVEQKKLGALVYFEDLSKDNHPLLTFDETIFKSREYKKYRAIIMEALKQGHE